MRIAVYTTGGSLITQSDFLAWRPESPQWISYTMSGVNLTGGTDYKLAIFYLLDPDTTVYIGRSSSSQWWLETTGQRTSFPSQINFNANRDSAPTLCVRAGVDVYAVYDESVSFSVSATDTGTGPLIMQSSGSQDVSASMDNYSLLSAMAIQSESAALGLTANGYLNMLPSLSMDTIASIDSAGGMLFEDSMSCDVIASLECLYVLEVLGSVAMNVASDIDNQSQLDAFGQATMEVAGAFNGSSSLDAVSGISYDLLASIDAAGVLNIGLSLELAAASNFALSDVLSLIGQVSLTGSADIDSTPSGSFSAVIDFTCAAYLQAIKARLLAILGSGMSHFD